GNAKRAAALSRLSTRTGSRMKRSRLAVLSLLLGALVLGITSTAWAQSVELSVNSRQIYSDVPFVLQLTAADFEESPEPTVSDFEIPGATVSFLGMSPSVMSRRVMI